MEVAIRIFAMIGMFIFGYMLGKESKGKDGKADSVKHGKWNTVVHSNNHVAYYCPECGSIFNKGCADLGDYNYCPNCGTDMREVEDD